ncbi:ATP-binding protein [Brevibacillus fluminis]|uniref:ATP-binding protein n=1 Tax=Brevibacillus fluminis TaxID=511487 RepID=A0A3M8CWK3_9BACL|nr:ATP-binding protein [Brevibacillus fluminis]RNB79751.1 ATP-binding protein [Brevibacillus fluminis]
MTNGGFVQIPNGCVAELATYKEQGVLDYEDNPIIEALPPILDMGEVIDALTLYPKYHPNERKSDDKYKLHLVRRLGRYFQPTTKHIELEQRISVCIRQGYISRNPLGKLHALRLQKGNKALKEKEGITSVFGDIRNTGNGFAIIGTSGMGKTTSVERVLSMYPKVIIHHEYKGTPLSLYQVTYLKLDCPYDGASLKGLCISFFLKMDELLGTNYSHKVVARRISVEEMLKYMVQIASNHCLGVLIIDEVQHLHSAAQGGADKMLNFFVTLVNTIGIPVILIGTQRALGSLQSQFRQARRSAGQGDMVWDRMNKDEEWDTIMELMWEYQWTKAVTPYTDQISSVLYEESQGITDIAVKLYMLAQIRVISSSLEKITPDLIRKVGRENLRLVQPFLQALRNGDIESLTKFDDIRPVDIESYIQNKLSELDKKSVIRLHKEALKKKQESERENILEELIIRLISMGVSDSDAKKAAKEAISELGIEVSINELARKAGENAFTNSRQKSAEIKKKKLNQKETIKDENDLRYVILKKNQEITAYDALKEAGYILDPFQELA